MAAVDWMRANGEQFGMDTSKVNGTYLVDSIADVCSNCPASTIAFTDPNNNVYFTTSAFNTDSIPLYRTSQFAGRTIIDQKSQFFRSGMEKTVSVFGHEAAHTLGIEPYFGTNHVQGSNYGHNAMLRYRGLYGQ